MKKTTAIIILAILVLAAGMEVNANSILKKGERGEEVKAIQEILKEDLAVYPEGKATGYFGELTEKAVKRLQKKFKLPETGVLDDKTDEVIFPYSYDVRITSPNGGEVWDRNQLQTITWKFESPIEKPVFWPKASIDLWRRVQTPSIETTTPPISAISGVLIKHIDFVNLFDRSYVWKINQDIPNGSEYVIRISSGRKILPCVAPQQAEGKAFCIREKTVPSPVSRQETTTAPQEKLPLPPEKLVFDESDNVFTITGEFSKPPSGPDLTEIITALKEVSRQLEQSIKILVKAIEKLSEITR